MFADLCFIFKCYGPLRFEIVFNTSVSMFTWRWVLTGYIQGSITDPFHKSWIKLQRWKRITGIFPSVHTGWWVNCQVENFCIFLPRNFCPILSYNFQIFFTLTLSICMMMASNSSMWPSSVPCFISRKYLGTLNSSSVDSIFTMKCCCLRLEKMVRC